MKKYFVSIGCFALAGLLAFGQTSGGGTGAGTGTSGTANPGSQIQTTPNVPQTSPQIIMPQPGGVGATTGVSG